MIVAIDPLCPLSIATLFGTAWCAIVRISLQWKSFLFGNFFGKYWAKALWIIWEFHNLCSAACILLPPPIPQSVYRVSSVHGEQTLAKAGFTKPPFLGQGFGFLHFGRLACLGFMIFNGFVIYQSCIWSLQMAWFWLHNQGFGFGF